MNGSKGEYRPILGPDGRPITIGRIVPDPAQLPTRPRWQHDPERPTHASFPLYCAWRATKCRLRDISIVEQHLEEMDEATHQFVGEVAELGELFVKHDVQPFYVPERRDELISEAGDIFFCGFWLLDAYRLNPFRAPDACPPNQIVPDEALAFARQVAEALSGASPEDTIEPESRQNLLYAVLALSWQMCVHAGLLCNFYKKIRWQENPQNRAAMAGHVGTVLGQCSQLLVMAGATVEDALARNIDKLDTRFPDGFVRPGGGIRQGKGA